MEMESFHSIEHLCESRVRVISVDEDNEIYKEGLLRVRKIQPLIIESDKKEAMLPLQGAVMWKKWAEMEQELHHQASRGDKRVHHYSDAIEREMREIRNEQLKHINLLSPVMESFIMYFLQLGGPSNRHNRNYFLQRLKLQLNNLSRKTISKLQYDYQLKRTILQDSSDSHDKEMDTTRIKLTEDLEELQQGIINSSFGLEHLFRELGQIYEAAVESFLFDENLSRLPRAAAEILIDGYPLEIMDGDAAHVPLKWVSAVLKEAAMMLGDPKVFVLSVLGLQSTGKSTMLNTVFGLQFKVSAGRCTRGAFMQLIPVDKELEETAGCGYVLVVDTEGLRAPQLDHLQTQKHDNKFATFAIGLANMTLINIYGEVPGDMEDILQTSVHAFLRMSLVNFSPSCQFVHQNAGANINSEVGRAKFTQKLNQFTLDAAKEENCEGQLKSFNDVIRFNDQTDVHCFPGLWKGSPPMAPVDKGYSISSQMLKQHFIKIMNEKARVDTLFSTEKIIGSLSLSSFRVRVRDLWKALLKENFVFSFKNTMEIMAYNSLESAYTKWEWKLQGPMLNWEQKAENEFNTAAVEDIPQLVKEKRNTLRDYVMKELYQPLKSEMEEFFNGKQSAILAQWKARYERRLKDLATDIQVHAEKHCEKLAHNKQTISEFEKKKTMYASKITADLQEHIASLREEQEKLNENLEESKLEPQQLKKIIERNLFTPENLKLFKDQKVLSDDQIEKINDIIIQCGGQLTEEGLKDILEEVISTEEMKSILKMARQSEEELNEQFNNIWDRLIGLLPSEEGSSTSVEERVEQQLLEFVRSKRYDGQLIEKLRNTKLKEWGENLELLPVEGKHFVKVGNYVQRGVQFVARKVRGVTDPDHIEAMAITERVFRVASQYLRNKEKLDTDFKTPFAKELLQLVDQKCADEEVTVRNHFKFEIEYKLEVYLTVCGYAIPIFERMAESFKKRNDPHLYLQQHVRGPLFTQYKNQYNQTKAEEGIAATVCAFLEEPLKEQVRMSLGAIMVGKIKNDEEHFSNKKALKVKILTDIHGTETEFHDYMVYVKDVQKCLQDQIKHYTMEYCNQYVSDKETMLQREAKEEASRLVDVVANTVIIVEERNVHKWLSEFGRNIEFRRETGVSLQTDDILSGYGSLHELNLDNFKREIEDGLNNLKKKLHSIFDSIHCESEMVHWKDKPHVLLENLVGCTEQCPFCGEQCDLLENHDGKHRTEVHRSSCLAGWRYVTSQVMVTYLCQSLVASSRNFLNPKNDHKPHPYREYDSVYTDWSISPDDSCEGSLFWKWFVKKYNEELAEEYNAKPAEVDEWIDLSWQEVERDLLNVYKL